MTIAETTSIIKVNVTANINVNSNTAITSDLASPRGGRCDRY